MKRTIRKSFCQCLLVFFLVYKSGVAQGSSPQGGGFQSGTCLILAWRGTNLAFGADTLVTHTYAFGSFQGEKRKFRTHGTVLLSAAGVVEHGDWSALGSAERLLGYGTQDQAADLKVVAAEWQREAKRHFDAQQATVPVGEVLVELSLISRRSDGTPNLVRALLGWNGRAQVLSLEDEKPPATGSTGVMLSGVCKTWFMDATAARNPQSMPGYKPSSYFSESELQALDKLVLVEKANAKSTGDLLQVVRDQEAFFTQFDKVRGLKIVGPPYEYGILPDAAKEWRICLDTRDCAQE